jgi:hypothetical protein
MVMAATKRVISDEHLAKMQAGARGARKAKAKAGKKCGVCGRKVEPQPNDREPYLRSSTKPGVIYCWPDEGCWVNPPKKKGAA